MIVVGSDNDGGNSPELTLSWSGIDTEPGDLAVIWWTHTSSLSETPPSGFTKLGEQVDNNVQISVFTRVCTGSESGSITFGIDTFSRNTSVLGVFRGTTGIDVSASAADPGSDANHVAPSVTPTVADAGVLIAMGNRIGTNGQTSSMTPPSGYTLLDQSAATGNGSSYTGVAYRGSGGEFTPGLSAGVSHSPGTMVANVGSSTTVVWTLALAPVVTAEPPFRGWGVHL